MQPGRRMLLVIRPGEKNVSHGRDGVAWGGVLGGTLGGTVPMPACMPASHRFQRGHPPARQGPRRGNRAILDYVWVGWDNMGRFSRFLCLCWGETTPRRRGYLLSRKNSPYIIKAGSSGPHRESWDERNSGGHA